VQYVPEVWQYHYVDSERLQFRYLLAKAYERTACNMRVNNSEQGRIPLYMYRKLFSYGFSALAAWSRARRRFFMIRLAASLGEIKGYRQAREDRRKRET
jgi:hypothetical protein